MNNANRAAGLISEARHFLMLVTESESWDPEMRIWKLQAARENFVEALELIKAFPDSGEARAAHMMLDLALSEHLHFIPTDEGDVEWFLRTIEFIRQFRDEYDFELERAIYCLRAIGSFENTTDETATTGQASLTHTQAAALLWEKRGYIPAESTCRSDISEKLKSPEHRDGKRYLRQSAIDLAAQLERKAAEKANKKPGKNKKTVTHKF